MALQWMYINLQVPDGISVNLRFCDQRNHLPQLKIKHKYPAGRGSKVHNTYVDLDSIFIKINLHCLRLRGTGMQQHRAQTSCFRVNKRDPIGTACVRSRHVSHISATAAGTYSGFDFLSRTVSGELFVLDRIQQSAFAMGANCSLRKRKH